MADLAEVASRVRVGLIEMAETLRAVEQPGLAQWAERMAEELATCVHDALGETSLDIQQEREGSPVEELAVVAENMRKLREKLQSD